MGIINCVPNHDRQTNFLSDLRVIFNFNLQLSIGKNRPSHLQHFRKKRRDTQLGSELHDIGSEFNFGRDQ